MFYNPNPKTVFNTIDDLKEVMSKINSQGADFLLYCLEGNIKQSKGFWKTKNKRSKKIYADLLKQNPILSTENPFQNFEEIKQNPKVIISSTDLLSDKQKKIISNFQKGANDRIVFSGGPAPKMAAVIASLAKVPSEIQFLIDTAKLSNESNSASYLHINHANALNAEFENTGLGVLPSIFKRNLFGEKNPSVALSPDYKKIDLWFHNICLSNLAIFILNILHGFQQQLRKVFNIKNDHDKSRVASFQSSKILAFIERKTGVNLTLNEHNNRAFFINYGVKEHLHTIEKNKYLTNSIGLESRKLSKKEIQSFYGLTACDRLSSVDVFPDNTCITHGLDKVVKDISLKQGFDYLVNNQILEVCIQGSKAVAIWVENITTGKTSFLPVSAIGLSLGPQVKYQYKNKQGLKEINPIQNQTIATGVSCQVLFKITDVTKFKAFPFTGFRQTHFVEMAHNEEFVLVKLTAGGNIAETKYSRSYAINALANMLHVITPDCGLIFYDVVSAFPCARGINATNNGQAVRIADNFVIRFGEGGTGMSKMASNAQVMMDLMGIKHELDEQIIVQQEDYLHTVLDHRQRTVKALSN